MKATETTEQRSNRDRGRSLFLLLPFSFLFPSLSLSLCIFAKRAAPKRLLFSSAFASAETAVQSSSFLSLFSLSGAFRNRCCSPRVAAQLWFAATRNAGPLCMLYNVEREGGTGTAGLGQGQSPTRFRFRVFQESGFKGQSYNRIWFVVFSEFEQETGLGSSPAPSPVKGEGNSSRGAVKTSTKKCNQKEGYGLASMGFGSIFNNNMLL